VIPYLATDQMIDACCVVSGGDWRCCGELNRVLKPEPSHPHQHPASLLPSIPCVNQLLLGSRIVHEAIMVLQEYLLSNVAPPLPLGHAEALPL
jgi:hypothetical protein